MPKRRNVQADRRQSVTELLPADERPKSLAHPQPSSSPVEAAQRQPSTWDQATPASASAPAAGQYNAMGQATNVNVTTNVAGPTLVFSHRKTGPGFFTRALWYVFVGSWASLLAIITAYIAMLTVIGLPFSFAIFNRLPTILTLRPRTQQYATRTKDGITYVELGNERQRPWWQRTIYFLCVGFWFGAIWLVFAWAISIFVVTLPLTFWMFNRASGVMTLHRH